MAIIKYPNYLAEILKLKLKENCFDGDFEKPSSEKKKFKFSNVSEECLNLAVQLARQDVLYGNGDLTYGSKTETRAPYTFDKTRRKLDDVDGDDYISNVQDINSNPPKARTPSPPTRDLNLKPAKGKRNLLSEKEVSSKVNRLIIDINKMINQAQVLATVDVKIKSKKNEDPIEAERRRVRLGERLNRISRLSYDLNRGLKDLSNDIKRGRKQDALKKLLHSYKESLKILKMITMHMSDSTNPLSFLRSKVFLDLISFYSDIYFSGMELNIELDSENVQEMPDAKLKNIVDSSRERFTNFPQFRQPLPPPSSPRTIADDNNNHLSSRSVVCATNSVSPGDLGALKDHIKKSKHLRHNSTELKHQVIQDSRKEQLNQMLKILLANLNGKGVGREVSSEVMLVENKSDGSVLKSISNNENVKSQNRIIDVRSRTRDGLELSHKKDAAPASSLHKDIVRETNCVEFDCKHGTAKSYRSKSSPPNVFKQLKISSGSHRHKKAKASHIGHNKQVAPKGGKRSKSLSQHEVCPNCGVNLEIDQNSYVNESISENSSSPYNLKDESESFDEEGYSTLNYNTIKKLDQKLNEFEIERKKMKDRWKVGFRDLENQSSDIYTTSPNEHEIPWIESFANEFRKDVSTAKSIFVHPLNYNESGHCELSDNFSHKLLQDWERRDREFFSFNLFNGETGVEDCGDAPCSANPKIYQNHPNLIPARANYLGDDLHRWPDLKSKLSSVSIAQEPVNLHVDRDALSALVMQNENLKVQVKDAILRLINSEDGNIEDRAFLSSRVAKDLLEDCLHEVCNEVDFVGNEIVDRIYKSELCANNAND